MPIWKDAAVPDSIPFQQAPDAQGERWGAEDLIERWASQDRAASPELGEVTEGMLEGLRDFMAASWLGRWDEMSLKAVSEGERRLSELGWSTDKISFERSEDGSVGVWIRL